ncbi:MAG: endonuclease/exonuclease/phosphatase family protein [Phycisphaerales bacterium]|nr:MAG: endonuclease/exonuclease/phosphatase family protein [Phycisphaerales bacterium]
MATTRRRLIALLSALLTVGLYGCHGGAAKPQEPHTLRVLTYNIHHGEGTDERFDYKRLARVINDLSPDIVALQEVDRGTERASGVDQAALLGKLCKMHHAFGQAMPYQGGRYGEAVLSRFPIEKVNVHPLPFNLEREPRAALEVRVEIKGIGPLVFVGTHLCHQDDELRTLQTRRMSRLFDKEEGPPIILAGDFNARPGSDPMNVLLQDGWTDVVAPRSRIDYILVRAADPWQVKELTILDEPVASDHDPVLAVLEWQGE